MCLRLVAQLCWWPWSVKNKTHCLSPSCLTASCAQRSMGIHRRSTVVQLLLMASWHLFWVIFFPILMFALKGQSIWCFPCSEGRYSTSTAPGYHSAGADARAKGSHMPDLGALISSQWVIPLGTLLSLDP